MTDGPSSVGEVVMIGAGRIEQRELIYYTYENRQLLSHLGLDHTSVRLLTVQVKIGPREDRTKKITHEPPEPIGPAAETRGVAWAVRLRNTLWPCRRAVGRG